MALSEKAVLIITGAWHLPEHYAKVVDLLEAKGIRVITPRLPTNNNVVPPNKSIHDDVACIREIVAAEAATGTRLTVLAHSYGGVVASAALGDFAIQPDSSAGGVAQMLFMCAFIPSENQSLAGIFGGQLPPYLTSIKETNTIVWTDPIHHMYNDLTEEEAAWAEGLRVAHSHDAQYTPIDCDKAAWRVIPLNYLYCTNDQAMPLFVQEMMVGNVKKEGIEVTEHRCDAGHSPFLSVPETVSETVIKVMG